MLALACIPFKHNIVVIRHKYIYALLWYFGICLGIFNGGSIPCSFYSVIHESLCERVSITWALVAALFPYLLYFVLVHSWGKTVLAFISFSKAFCKNTRSSP